MIAALPALLALAVLADSPPAPPQPLLLCDSSTKRVAIIDPDGSTRWERTIGPAHDLHWLPGENGRGGHVLMQDSWTHLLEVDPATDEVVWEYDAREALPAGYDGKLEVHAFQRLDDGNTMIALSGPGQIVEVTTDGAVATRLDLTIDEPHPHRDTRLARKTAAGTYLVSHEGDGVIREYDGDGTVIWEYAVPLFDRPRAKGHGPKAWGNQAFGVVRLPSGNTLISTGNGHGVIEVTPDRQIVWRLSQHDLPGITLAWTTHLQVLGDDTILLTNCHAGPDNPQVIALTRDKTVLWSYRDFTRFGNATTNAVVRQPLHRTQ